MTAKVEGRLQPEEGREKGMVNEGGEFGRERERKGMGQEGEGMRKRKRIESWTHRSRRGEKENRREGDDRERVQKLIGKNSWR